MIVLDTRVLIWWINDPKKLSKKAREIIDQEKHREENILVSSISTLEIYRLVKNGKLQLINDIDSWLEKIESLPAVKFIPIDNKVAIASINLPDFSHKDPADRIIIATAQIMGAVLITSDKKILNYKHVQTCSADEQVPPFGS